MSSFVYTREAAYEYLLKNFSDLLISSTHSPKLIELIKFSQLYIRELAKNIVNYKNLALYKKTNKTYKEIYISWNFDSSNKHDKFIVYFSKKLKTKIVYNYSILLNEINNFLDTFAKNKEYINEFDSILNNPNSNDYDSNIDSFESKLLMYYIENFQEYIISDNNLFSSFSYEAILSKYDHNIEHSFLSYAYNDRLFTVSLYLFFLKELNVELYIDWMHNPKINDGKILKESLLKQLKHSDNLYLLRSPYSEYFNGENLRDFCAWETGCYASIIDNENNSPKKLYLLNTIHSFKNNLFYDDFQLIGDVLNNVPIKKTYLK